MTARNYAAMTDAELNEAVAQAMGWHCKRKTSERYFDADGKMAAFSWYPNRSVDDSHRFSSWFMDEQQKKGRWYNLTIESVIQQNAQGVQVRRYRCKLWRGQVIDRDSGIFYALCDTMSRAMTEATLQAWNGAV